MIKETTNKCYKTLILCLILLINPNINTLDILPDFIAWFLLARLFTEAADSASYFEEARVAFMRLGYISAAKIPAFFLMLMIRGIDNGDTDIFALTSLTFGVLELIFLIPAVKNIFEALFHLGQRTEAVSLISPIAKDGKNGKTPERLAFTMPESVRGLTYLFFVCKTILYVMPDMLLLSSITDRGPVIKLLKYYPIVFLLSVTVTLALGIKWLVTVRRYILAVKEEGRFQSALLEVATEDSKEKFERKVKLRSAHSALTLLAVAAFPSFELVFSNLDEINLLPRTIYGLFVIFAILKLREHSTASRLPLISAIIYTVSATLAYIFHVSFYSRFETLDLMREKAAQAAYLALEITAVIEFAALLFMLFSVGRYIIREFVLSNTGVSPSAERYGRTEREYHSSLIKRGYLLVGFGALAGVSRLVNIFLNHNVQLIFSDITDVTRPAFAASALPWFGLVVVAATVLYAGYSIYYTSTLKDEVDMKYSFEQ